MSDRLGVRTGDTGQYRRTHRRRTPLTPDEVTRAREAEQARKRFDPHYMTADEARQIPSGMIASRPDLQDRIRYSQPDWPENRMSATQALGPLPGGSGETVERRAVGVEEIFRGRPVKGEQHHGE